MFSRSRLSALALILIGGASAAFAHPGHGVDAGLSGGLLHPLTGLDHLLMLVVVGLLAAQHKAALRWGLPALFLTGLLGGAAAGFSGGGLPMVETGLILALVFGGALLARGGRISALLIGGLGVFAGGLHGYAHTAEAAGTATLGYILGILIMSAATIAASYALGRAAVHAHAASPLRWSGAAIAAVGLALFW